MYADGKLDIEPVTNYFDRVLLGKIVKSYRSYMNRTKTTFQSLKAKKQKDNKEIIFYFEEYRDKKSLTTAGNGCIVILNQKDC